MRTFSGPVSLVGNEVENRPNGNLAGRSDQSEPPHSLLSRYQFQHVHRYCFVQLLHDSIHSTENRLPLFPLFFVPQSNIYYVVCGQTGFPPPPLAKSNPEKYSQGRRGPHYYKKMKTRVKKVKGQPSHTGRETNIYW